LPPPHLRWTFSLSYENDAAREEMLLKEMDEDEHEQGKGGDDMVV